MLKENQYLRICTHNKDGTVHAVPVAYRYLNGQILITSIAKSRKNRNIERKNEVSVLVDTPDRLRVILIYGNAEIGYDDVYEQSCTVMETFLRGMLKEEANNKHKWPPRFRHALGLTRFARAFAHKV
jgi:hypothetical protein